MSKEISINNEINRRQLVIQLLALCAGGTIGLAFIPLSIKSGFFIVLGLYYTIVFIINYINIDRKIDKMISELEEKK